MNSRFPFFAAPSLVLAYGVIRILDGLDGSHGPGFAWASGHLAFVAALLLFVPIFWHMRRVAGRGTLATVSAVVGTAGVAALLAQFGIDLAVGFMSADHAGMSVLFDRVRAVPGVPIAVYDVGPYLFYVGQLLLFCQLAVQRRVRAWALVPVLGYLILPLVTKDLIPLSAFCLIVAFTPLARGAVSQAAPRPSSALV
ncbi:hypothetical protein [Microbispora sp. ATCC PTA-5024]|uniref:hypothetical protein n=1 Tax=Microbispora sp. ATCC PTA-5024 TaxID=316330 RepID=UPI0003DDEC95|nr:hypothetical protein [Microbispora sp. ATCC PTA-5024]ETK33006.1 hypothetical protein MPTA5024_26810 [Microbispora sp. ATCC PTA-5024]